MTRAERAALFDRFVASQPRDLQRADAERVAQLIQSDPRCCARLPVSFRRRQARTRFRRWLDEAWLQDQYSEVLDYRRRLIRSAAQNRRQRAPAIAIILYATWIEHTVNAIVIGAARMTKFDGSVDDLARRIVSRPLHERLGRLWTRYEAPPLDRTVKARIQRFADKRNDLVHYKWIGLEPSSLEAELEHMRTLVANVSSIVAYLRNVESQITTLKFRPRIRKLLALDRPRAT